jgi:biopolymer transport protein ExbB/TolQ
MSLSPIFLFLNKFTAMKRSALSLLVFLSLSSLSYSQNDSVAEAKANVAEATKSLLNSQKEHADLRRHLYKEINELDDQVIELSKELRQLERDEALRTTNAKKLDKEIDTRKTQFIYTSGLLNQYSKAFVTRIHPSEYQLYREPIGSIDQSALNAANEPVKEITERSKVLALGIKRLKEISGGSTFDGKALGFAGKSIDGKFMIMGPSVFFANSDGLSEGICPAQDTGSNFPAFVSINKSGGVIAKTIQSGVGMLPFDGTLGKAITAEMKSPGGQNKALEHIMLFNDIAKNMMFDGWIAIGICVLMIAIGWTVAARKIFFLNSIEKGNREFLQQWSKVSNDLTTLERNSDASDKTKLNETPAMKRSPFYDIYHIGSEEITHRIAATNSGHKGLSGRSIQAVRAALDSGLVQLQHKLTDGLVYLTISIAGGPYVGLLGTVVGVMITFAIISKEGEVNVNAIAPGIASALLATVAGLIVAIPALFVYSYLNNRIKNITSEVKVFIDEFVAKMAEFYPQVNEAPSPKFSDSDDI